MSTLGAGSTSQRNATVHPAAPSNMANRRRSKDAVPQDGVTFHRVARWYPALSDTYEEVVILSSKTDNSSTQSQANTKQKADRASSRAAHSDRDTHPEAQQNDTNQELRPDTRTETKPNKNFLSVHNHKE